MSDPSVGRRVIRAQVAVASLAVLIIAMFVAIWVGLGKLGVADAPRLFAAFCIPPILLGLGAGLFYIRRQNRNS